MNAGQEISVPATLLDAMAAKAARAHPNEACGLLLGHGTNVTDLVFSANRTPADPTTNFEIDAGLHARLQRETRGTGKEVVGVWHSHPSGEAAPSQADQKQSVMPGWLWLITAAGKTTGWIAGEAPPYRLTACTTVTDGR